MKFTKSLLFTVAVSLAALISSCTKNVDQNYSVDIDLSFVTTDEMADLTIRQYEILVDGKTVRSGTITGSDFSKTETLINLEAPATIDVEVTAHFAGSVVPESVSALNTYNVSAKYGNSVVSYSNKDSRTTVTRAKFSEYLSLMNHTKSFKLNENGVLSKTK